MSVTPKRNGQGIRDEQEIRILPLPLSPLQGESLQGEPLSAFAERQAPAGGIQGVRFLGI
jgi:hypothetical protein